MPGIKMVLTTEQVALLNQGNVIVEENGTKWMNYPFWFKSTEEEEIYEIYSVQELPDRISQLIDKPKKEEIDYLNYPHKQLDIFEDGVE